MSACIVWLRRDLRTADNPALCEAASRGAVVPVFIWSPEEEQPWAPGAASRVWLHRSLDALAAQLQALGSPLVLRTGSSLEVLRQLARECAAPAVLWNRCHDPAFVARDARIKAALRGDGLDAHSHADSLLHEPHAVHNKQGRAFRVFGAYYRHCRQLLAPAVPLPAPPRLQAPDRRVRSLALARLDLLPRIRWDAGVHDAWTPGGAGAARELDAFADDAVTRYGEDRDRPDRAGVSRLSPHLHFGEISPRQIWHRVMQQHGSHPGGRDAVEPYLRQLYWREFAHHLLFHFPDSTSEPLQPKFARFPWRGAGEDFHAWCHGRTGYPFVDAGMRELWHTGWMHNRVRMNVASFLVKHLLVHWREGARWFWDTLVDADLANNSMGWQWCAGSGADAAPYFRIFNPVIQGQRFDPQGGYVRRWVPEIARLPDTLIHKPWQAPPAELARAGVSLGRDYPVPIVDHASARQRALDALASTR